MLSLEQLAAAPAPERARASCCAFRGADAWCDVSATRAWAAGLEAGAIAAFARTYGEGGLATNRFSELSFEGVEDEAGFIALAHALDFGSGFRRALHARHGGCGAWKVVRAGLVRLGAAQSPPRAAAASLSALTLPAVTDLFELDAPDGSLAPLAAQILCVCHEIGRALAARGARTLGAFVLDAVLPVAPARTGSAARLVDALVDAFPVTFDDAYVAADAEGRPSRVCLYKKAQLVASELHGRFGRESPAFAFHDFGRLTAFVDNVVVAMARQAGAVACTRAVAADIEAGRPLHCGGGPEVALRAAALHAVEVAVETINTGAPPGAAPMVPAELCNWLWGYLGKTPGGKAYERHAVPGTLFY